MIFLCTNNDKNTEMFKIDDQMEKKVVFKALYSLNSCLFRR